MLKTELHSDSVEITIGRERQFRACASGVAIKGFKPCEDDADDCCAQIAAIQRRLGEGAKLTPCW